MKRLTSLSNPAVKELVRLQRESSERRRRGLFIIESERELKRAISADFELVEFYTSRPGFVPVALADAQVIEVTDQIIAKAAYRENPEGFIAVLRPRMTALEQVVERLDAGPLIVCSGLEKPGNIGAILRSADAAGAAAMLIDRPDADVFNPNIIRASTGAVFTMPIVTESAERIAPWLREHSVRILAATPDGAVEHTQADLSGRCAIVMGAEAEGLNAFWNEAADVRVAVPMRGHIVDSLNVSVTAAVLLYESLRQRASA